MKKLSLLCGIFTLLLSGCYDPALNELQTYKMSFACTKSDLQKFENLIHRYFSGQEKLEFSDGSENAYIAFKQMNELLWNRCPVEKLKECSDDGEAREEYDADFDHASKYVRGPIEAFGIIAISETTYGFSDHPKPVYVSYLGKGSEFKAALRCFSRR